MSDHGATAYRYGAINRQMQRLAGEHERSVRQTWIDRVLAVLDSDNLINQAGSGRVTEDSLLFDCNVAPLVWDDPRIAYRRQQLEGSGVTAELIDHQHDVANKTFKRTQIKITFSA